MPEEIDDVEEALRLQDEALALLERLRIEEPIPPAHGEPSGGGRRDFRRWPVPDGVVLEFHDGTRWQTADCVEMGRGGVRLNMLPRWIKGPVPARLKAQGIPAVLVLADIMWREKDGTKAGMRFEFLDDEERDLWSDGLIDALLARYSLV